MLFALVGFALASTAPMASSEEARVLAAVDRFFKAIEARDEVAMANSVVPEGQAAAVRLNEAGPSKMMTWHWSTYLANVANSRAVVVEHLFDPQVRIDRDIASVWARYDVVVDGKFSHCGLDHFDMVRLGGQWRVYNLTWTNQKSGCAGH